MAEPNLQGAAWVAKVNHDALLLAAADALAAWLHRDDRDKQGRPLIEHCRRVAAILRDQGHPAEVQAAGLLHEVIEDSLMTYDEVRRWFGETVAETVLWVSRDRARPYADHVTAVIEGGKTVAPWAPVVKLADLANNLDESRGPIPASLRKRYLRAVARLEKANG